jgi:hypothetical protein
MMAARLVTVPKRLQMHLRRTGNIRCLSAVAQHHGEVKQMNLFTAINDAMSIAMETDPTAICFGEDVAFGGVFRTSQGLQDKFGKDRVFNTVRHAYHDNCVDCKL